MTPESKKRIITGLVGAVGLICLILFGKWLGILLISFGISLGMVIEFCHIVFSLKDRSEKRYALLSISWFVTFVSLIVPQAEFMLCIFCFLILFSYFLFSARRYSGELLSIHFKELMACVFALIYLIFIPLYFLKIYEISGGVSWIVVFFCMVWASDTLAYFVGKRWGKSKLYPSISPKKTVEGALAGLSASIGVFFIFKFIWYPSLSWVVTLLCPVLVGGTAQVGDLCESFFKRAFDRKDSGSILPGHGGFLDRFDGVVFSLPVMYICIRLLG